jgi:hypothetical protein
MVFRANDRSLDGHYSLFLTGPNMHYLAYSCETGFLLLLVICTVLIVLGRDILEVTGL